MKRSAPPPASRLTARARQRLRDLLLEGARSPLAGVADRRYFDSLRAQVRKHAK